VPTCCAPPLVARTTARRVVPTTKERWLFAFVSGGLFAMLPANRSAWVLEPMGRTHLLDRELARAKWWTVAGARSRLTSGFAKHRTSGGTFPFAAWSMMALVLAVGSCDGFECVCGPCSLAVSLAVVDGNGAAITTGWQVEAMVDGTVVDTANCAELVRAGNQCAFGNATGVYEIVVRTENQEKRIVARSASTDGDCCRCVRTENVVVVLADAGL
jgi:hypothetical protein